jgi:deferrochelatase/peroxidase EfeB
MTRITRRRLLGVAGVSAAGLAAGGTGLAKALEGDGRDDTVPFYGPVQSGITTPAQDRLHFASFDVATTSRRELRDLMRAWTEASARMCAGRAAGPVNATGALPPDDTGEALGLTPARLTITFGFGPTLFDDRFGLASKRPAALIDLPPFADDSLQPERSGGDLAVQACTDDPQVAFHAVRNLARIGRGIVYMRWSQLGFGRTSSTSRAQDTPRNLMGFKDGTNNIKLEDEDALRRFVWVGEGDDPAWMRNGSYLVSRRIRMLIEVWDRATLDDQEQTIGRHKSSGAPLGATREFDAVDRSKLPVDAHVRLAKSDVRILRRGYSFTDGVDDRLGQLDAGLFFLAFQRDPRTQFVPLQRRLAQNDALNEYISHTGSAIFAVPPGATGPGRFVGDGLL